jgi:protein-S-isoprenylcysteine O-methyltransferase Ste14
MTQNDPSAKDSSKKVKLSPHYRGAIRFLSLCLITGAALFLTAGTFKWVEAWILMGMAVVNMGVLGLTLSRELKEERASDHENVKEWDRWIAACMVVICPTMVYLLAGLDKRFDWSPNIGWGVKGVCIAVVVIGYLISDWAMASNPFFSANVRIQTERDHRVISQGPYLWIRHPGYMGSLFAALAIPFLLESLWALIPAGIWIGLIVLRTRLEDETLVCELNGYREYTDQVRHRIFPGLW